MVAGMKWISAEVLRAPLLMAAVLAAPVVACAQQPGPDDPLRVCADPYMLPFSNEKRAGYENRIAELFASRLGKELEYEWFPQRQGFIRNTLRAEGDDGRYKCDLVMTVPDHFELAATSRPYFASTYYLVIAKGRGLDDISAPEMLAKAAESGRSFRIALSDQGPGQLWVFRNGLMGSMIPYIGQPGDPTVNPGEVIMRDLAAGKADVSIVWGPTAGYFARVLKDEAQFIMLPLHNDARYPDMPFEYNMSMAVRHGEKEWLATVNRFIAENGAALENILKEYGVPLIPIRQPAQSDDDDD
jgi:quinoprotein dehydrogenase-associated probable ABC transporter substrate-binding protein